MKKHLINKKSLLVFLLITFGIFTKSNAQVKLVKYELLVYILPDSLEIPTSEKGEISYDKALIKSKTLKNVMERINSTSIARSLPDWNAADSVYTRAEDGRRIKKPALHRIFTFKFKNEEELITAEKLLKESKSVLYVHRQSEPTTFSYIGNFAPDPNYTSGDQWHLKNDGRNGGIVGADINAENAWNIFTGSSAVTIGVFDTGVELTHDELNGKSSGDAYVSGYGTSYHGTHVAGIAAGKANNGKGGRGVDWNAQISSNNIFLPSYIGDAAVAAKIITAANNGVQVNNHSWGGSTYSATLEEAFAYAYKLNRTSIVSTGNDFSSSTKYPAGFENVIAVGATTNSDAIAGYSNTGSHVDVAAPGGDAVAMGSSTYIFFCAWK